MPRATGRRAGPCAGNPGRGGSLTPSTASTAYPSGSLVPIWVTTATSRPYRDSCCATACVRRVNVESTCGSELPDDVHHLPCARDIRRLGRGNVQTHGTPEDSQLRGQGGTQLPSAVRPRVEYPGNPFRSVQEPLAPQQSRKSAQAGSRHPFRHPELVDHLVGRDGQTGRDQSVNRVGEPPSDPQGVVALAGRRLLWHRLRHVSSSLHVCLAVLRLKVSVPRHRWPLGLGAAHDDNRCTRSIVPACLRLAAPPPLR